MLRCPNCQRDLTYQVRDDEFECPFCQTPLRRFTGQDGFQSIVIDYFAKTNRPRIQLPDQPDQLIGPSKKKNPSSRLNFPESREIGAEVVQPKILQPSREQLERSENLLRSLKTKSTESTTSSGGRGWAFIYGVVLMGLGIYVFSRLITLELDLGGYLALAIVAVVSGVLTSFIAKWA